MNRFALPFALAALACGGAHAFQDVRSEYSANRSMVNVGRVTSTATITAAGASAKAVGSVPLHGPGGRVLTTNAALFFDRGLTARVAASALARSLIPGVGAAVLAYEIYDAIRVRPVAGGGLAHDPGQDQAMAMVGTWTCQAGHNGSTLGAACSSYFAANFVGVFGNRTRSLVGSANCYTTSDGTTGICEQEWTSVHDSNPSDVFGGVAAPSAWFAVAESLACPGWFDNSTGTYHPAGSTQPGYGGKCPTGSYTVPKTAEEAGDMANASDWNAENLPGLLSEAAGQTDGFRVPAGTPTEWVEETPAPKVSGGTSTTTKPDGTVVETWTEWNFARDPLRKNEGTWPKTTTTTTTPPGGPPGTPETIVETPEPGGPEDKDPCVTNPDRLGCIKLGDVPDVEMPKSTVSIDVTPASGWGNSNAACPTMGTLTIAGIAVPIDNTVFCDFFSMIRPFVIAFSYLAAAGIVIGGIRS
ncbi:MAG: virulence factor TspB C-terminal domain-related protein [Rubrivivax sp.]|nr:virulence factor TspB C-terminal domain-related protein [Rubrivivax sp.]MDP3614326.1 virulence factor TspB C-terminal domain-related protein [Rubrivivax sp.]